jgi:arabinose-5-phosphate isomerase
LFVHAADAAHGDLGMVTHSDVLMLVSHSGATEELLRLLPHFEELGVPIISLVGQPGSPLALAADVAICTQVEREACPHNVLVTTSALVTLALADALALAVMQHNNVSVGDLGRRHPRGSLGRKLTRRVGEVMHRKSLPLVPPEMLVQDALLVMTGSPYGILVVVDVLGAPVGVVTPEDLRAGFALDHGMLAEPIACLMTPAPLTVSDQVSLHSAYERMTRLGEHALVVVDDAQRVVGILLDERRRRT